MHHECRSRFFVCVDLGIYAPRFSDDRRELVESHVRYHDYHSGTPLSNIDHRGLNDIAIRADLQRGKKS